MNWRESKALLTLRDQVNIRWPDRSKDSDGTIGDEAHQHRKSDHDPDANGVVCAMDITHDPQHGFDSYAFADVLRASRDTRISYIISNRRICNSQVDPWQWRDYHGINPHDHHVHISVIDKPQFYDDVSAWNLDAKQMPPPVSVAAVAWPTLRKGASGDAVEHLQALLNSKSIIIKVDGDFGQATYKGVKRFQSSRGLISEGVCGPQTWAALTTK